MAKPSPGGTRPILMMMFPHLELKLSEPKDQDLSCFLLYLQSTECLAQSGHRWMSDWEGAVVPRPIF